MATRVGRVSALEPEPACMQGDATMQVLDAKDAEGSRTTYPSSIDLAMAPSSILVADLEKTTNDLVHLGEDGLVEDQCDED